ncbi:MAG TPA: hypothetical protein VJZ00_20620 [Thermoanaerobaculia bacterium]|nr:hypothetical protein [Thermoanaerobaculia bacterium]
MEWHRNAGDRWTWYGWTVWAGERQRWLVYATFGHSAADLDSPVSPAEDERDNVSNVTPHGQFLGHGLYEFLPALSNGTGVPAATPRVELMTVDVAPVSQSDFEAALAAQQSSLQNETLWYRMLAGGPVPRYVRLRPRKNLSTLLNDPTPLPDFIAKATIEILNLRPTMCHNVTVA